jgi:hypothetical protein
MNQLNAISFSMVYGFLRGSPLKLYVNYIRGHDQIPELKKKNDQRSFAVCHQHRPN